MKNISKIPCLFGFHRYKFQVCKLGTLYYVFFTCNVCGESDGNWQYRYFSTERKAEKYIEQCLGQE